VVTLTAVRLFRKRPDLRPLGEQECYLRLHGRRSGDVEVVARMEPPEAEPPEAEPPEGRTGPTDTAPAVHLLIAYPREGSRLTGEQLRRELLRRMEARSGEAA
jgi:hypothetical protein